jgi:hypothetical protein
MLGRAGRIFNDASGKSSANILCWKRHHESEHVLRLQGVAVQLFIVLLLDSIAHTQTNRDTVSDSSGAAIRGGTSSASVAGSPGPSDGVPSHFLKKDCANGATRTINVRAKLIF